MQRRRMLVVAGLVLLFSGACRDASFPTAIDPAIAHHSAEVRTGWIFGPEGLPIELKYMVVDGLSIHEGDINLGPAGTVPKTREELLGRERRDAGALYGVVIDGNTYRWPNGIVPYTISSSFNSTQQQAIVAGMAHIAGTSAGTTFILRTTQSNYVSFELSSSACNSEVGRRGGSQIINLTSGCAEDVGTVAHEMLHTLGLWHEQSRCDRDSYITVNLENVVSGAEHNFDKKCSGSTDILSYNEASIMHYGRYAFSSNWQPTISSTRGLNHLIGQHNGQLQQTDVSTINTIYDPYGAWATTANSGGTPLLEWTAQNGATSYRVWLTVIYNEVNGYENTSYSWEMGDLGRTIGTTSNTSILDSGYSYTGTDQCIVWDEWYGYARYEYYYYVETTFPDGIVTVRRNGALVAPSTC